MTVMTMVDALNSALQYEMGKDKTVVVLGEDVGVDGGVFRVTDGLLKKYGPKRVFDTPLAESGIVGTSIGLAVNGMKPVAEIQFSGFIPPAFDQLVSHAARIRNRSRGSYTCPLVVRSPYGGGIRALEHHAESYESWYIHAPGLKVVIPSTPYDAKGLLIASIRDPDPVVFLEPKKIYRAIKEEVPDKEVIVPLGKARIVQEGDDVTLISWGAMMRPTIAAAQKAQAEGISCDVIDVRTLAPCDWDTLLESAAHTGRVVVVHEAHKTLGFGAEITARINEKALFSLKAPVQRVTGFDVPFPYFKLENEYLPSAEKVHGAIKKVMQF